MKGNWVSREKNTPGFSKVGEQADYLQDQPILADGAIASSDVGDYYPVSSAQRRLFLLHQQSDIGISYNMPSIFAIQGELDLKRLENAFRKVILHQESLRTGFFEKNGQPFQRVFPNIPFAIEVVDLDQRPQNTIGNNTTPEEATSHLEKPEIVDLTDENEKQILNLLLEEFIQPFDLNKPPLLRVLLVVLKNRQYLLTDLHHIITDGFSMQVLIRELACYYAGDELPKLLTQYRDYTAWQQKLFTTDTFKEQEKYWLKQFENDIPTLALPVDFSRSTATSYVGDLYTLKVGLEMKDKILALAHDTKTTLYIFLLATFHLLLSKLSGQKDIIVGSPIAGRNHSDLENIIGFFVNTLALRTFVKEDLTFIEFLEQVKQMVFAAFENQDYPFELLVSNLELPREMNRNPLFDVVLSFENRKSQGFQLGDSKLLPYQINSHSAKFDINVSGMETEDGLAFYFEYRSNLYKRESISRFAAHFHQLLLEICEHPEKRLDEIQMVSSKERHKLLVEFNQTDTGYPRHLSLQDIFAEQVQKNWDQIALQFGDKSMTYGQLDERSNQLAHVLRKQGIQIEEIVGLMTEPSFDMLIGIWSILKAGGAYLPIDPGYPQERIEYMLEDSQTRLLIIQQAFEDQIEFSNDILTLDDPVIRKQRVEQVENLSSPWDLAYIIYTSGTTGQPKGIMTTHSNISRVVKETNYIEIKSTDRILQLSNYAFDGSTFGIFGAHLNGASLRIIPKETVTDLDQLACIIEKERINKFFVTTALFNALVDNNISALIGVEKILFGGERVSVVHVQKAFQKLGPGRLIHVYGPTESTVFATYYPIDFVDARLETIPIGMPLANTQVYILDENEQILPVGVVGELCISGEGLARGYLNRPQLTAEKFVEHPYYPGEKMYKTGDLARWLDDGSIEFIGRKDQQIKLRGFRIELGEIETRLLEYPGVEKTIVIAREDQLGHRYLCGYLVFAPDKSNSREHGDEKSLVADIRHYLASILPDYMIPTYLVLMDRLPLTNSGKVDWRQLPEPEVNQSKNYVAPRNAFEEKLAAIWTQTLGVQEIGIHENFFQLGGHSLKASQVVSMIQKELLVQIRLKDLFTRPTIAQLAEILRDGKEAEAHYQIIKPVEPADYYPVSHAQKRLWILHQLGQESTAYNIPGSFSFTQQEFDQQILIQTLQILLERHESLRTTFIVVDGEPMQKINPAQLDVEEINLRQHENGIDKYHQLMMKESSRGFDLEIGPLYRIQLIHLPQEHILHFTMHHIISDGWSMDIFKGEFLQLYRALKQGEPNPLSPLPIQYKDFANWQNQQLLGDGFVEHRNYWLKKLQGDLPTMALPVDKPYGAMSESQGAIYYFALEGALMEELRELGLRYDASLFMVLLSAFVLLLAHLTKKDEVLFGVPVAGREHADLKGIFGFFLNTIALINQVNWTERYDTFLQQIQKDTLEALNYQSYPFELIAEELDFRREVNQPGILSIIFNMLSFDASGKEELVSSEAEHRPLYQDTKFDMGCIIQECSNGLAVECHYRTSLFKAQTIEYIMGEYRRLLVLIADDCLRFLDDYPIFMSENLMQMERKVIPTNPYQYFPKEEIEQSLVERFEKQVTLYPDKLAVKSPSGQLTYSELNQQANRLAHGILEELNPAHQLSTVEMTRYGRQMMLDQWGLAGQKRLKQSKVFVAGAGGSGSPTIMQLALSGVGTIKIADPDQVDLSNLNRQVLHDESRIGVNKALSAQMTVERINPHVHVEAFPEKITRENVAQLVGDVDLIFDNVDDLEAKFVLSEYATVKGIPHIISSMMDINSYVAIFYPPHTPCFHCLYDREKLAEMERLAVEIKDRKKAANPVSAPALFVSTGFAVNEGLKILLGMENPAYNKYFFFNQKASPDFVNTPGYLAITYPFSDHFKALSKEQGFDWGEGWRGQYLEEWSIWPDPNCPICGQGQKIGMEEKVGDVDTEKEQLYPKNNQSSPGRSKARQLNTIVGSRVGAETAISEEESPEGEVPAGIALLFEHDLSMLVGIWGALKARRFYVPLDPTYPEERLLYMLEDSGVAVIVTNDKNSKKASMLQKKAGKELLIINTDALATDISVKNPGIYPSPDQLAYILYTSGSTGKPKGVMQNHRNVLHFIRTYTNNLRICSDDRLTLFSSYSFDAAIMDIYGALLNGATAYPFSIKEVGSGEKLVDWIRDQEITIYHSIPTVYRYFIDAIEKKFGLSEKQAIEDTTIAGNFPKLRLLVMGGEAVYRGDVELYQKYFADHVIFINGLGPTESTVTLQYILDKETEIDRQSVPVGYPVNETQVYLLDEKDQQVRVFGVGEIVYKSPYLALGYWRDPEKTAAKFGTDPLTGEGRVYRTGDLGRLLVDGSIEFVGRKDFQVKISGYRIELNEVEGAMDQLDLVKKSAVIALEQGSGEKVLVAYYIPVKDDIEENKLRQRLQQSLPQYMLPSRLIPVATFPLTPSGKIDRKELIRWDLAAPAIGEKLAPANEVETELAGLWAQVLELDVDEVGVNRSFFDLGGNSLKMIQLTELVNKHFDVNFKVSDFLNYTTIKEIAPLLGAEENEEEILKFEF